jgi:predicted RNase H-like nuclease (RuvC/YqgF family)
MVPLILRFAIARYGIYGAIALVISVGSASPPAWPADKKDSRQREAQRRTQQAIKQAQAKNAELEQANTELATRLKEKEQHAAEIANSLEGSARKNRRFADDVAREQSRAADLETRFKETESSLLQVRRELAEASASQRETQLQLKTVTSEKIGLDNTLSICLDKNDRLYQFGRELIDHVERPSGFSSILRGEPFTQINRVQLENIFQEARDNLDQNRMPPLSARSRNEPK